MYLADSVQNTLFRLDDEAEEVWSRDEIALYVKDGYDQFCRRSKCLFDVHVIENLAPVGNYSTDLERFLAEQTPGMGIMDRRMHFNTETERDLIAKSLEGPTAGTRPLDRGHFAGKSIPTTVSTGRLPDGTVDVIRVVWSNIALEAIGMAQLRQLAPTFDTTEGDPRWWAWSDEGVLTLRFYPIGGGDAVYDTISGARGSLRQTDETGLTINGSRGILRERVGNFPAGGPRGTVRRRHPDTDNFKVEISRLGRDLDSYAFEIPESFVKYVTFYAMSQALRRDGPGQDQKLAQHYTDRFELGLTRI